MPAVRPPRSAVHSGRNFAIPRHCDRHRLFDDIAPGGVALLRVLAGLVLIGFRRSWRRSWSRQDLLWAGGFGAAQRMNLFIYLAMDRLPLRNAVAIEFLGPIAVAAVGTRTLHRRDHDSRGFRCRDIGGVQDEGTLLGVLLALLAGTMWPAIVLGLPSLTMDSP